MGSTVSIATDEHLKHIQFQMCKCSSQMKLWWTFVQQMNTYNIFNFKFTTNLKWKLFVATSTNKYSSSQYFPRISWILVEFLQNYFAIHFILFGWMKSLKVWDFYRIILQFISLCLVGWGHLKCRWPAKEGFTNEYIHRKITSAPSSETNKSFFLTSEHLPTLSILQKFLQLHIQSDLC